MPSRREREPTVQVFPNQLRVGDRFADAEGEWAIACPPVGFNRGHDIRRRVPRRGDAKTYERYWPAHAKMTVTRTRPATPPVAAVPDEAGDLEAVRRENRRLRNEVLGLQEEKRDLEERLAFTTRQLQETRAK